MAGLFLFTDTDHRPAVAKAMVGRHGKRMELFKAPQGWHIIVNDARWRKPYGWFDRARKRIDVWPVKWIPRWFGLRDYFVKITRNHEVLHAWGNPGCGNPFCLGYEGATGKEYLAMPVQLMVGLRFCPYCKNYLSQT